MIVLAKSYEGENMMTHEIGIALTSDTKSEKRSLAIELVLTDFLYSNRHQFIPSLQYHLEYPQVDYYCIFSINLEEHYH